MFKTKNDLLRMAAPVQRVTGVLDNLAGRLNRISRSREDL